MHTEWTLFVNSGNCKTSELHRLLLSLADQINLKRSDKYVALLNSTIYCMWNLKYQLQHGMRSLIYLTDHILYQIFKIILMYLKKKHRNKTGNPSIKTYINKMENRITFKIKKVLSRTFNTRKMKLLGSTKKRISKNKNCEQLSSFRNHWTSIWIIILSTMIINAT